LWFPQIYLKVSAWLIAVDSVNDLTVANTSGEPNESMLNGLNDDEVIDNEQMPSDEEDGDDNPELLQ
jgi:hypothetical protein